MNLARIVAPQQAVALSLSAACILRIINPCLIGVVREHG